MKTLFIFIFIFVFSGMLFSQLNNADKISEFYGHEWCNNMQNDAPNLLVLLDKYIEYGFMVKDVSKGKYAEFDPLTSIPLTRKEGGEVSIEEFLADFYGSNFNPLKYKFFPGKDFQIYKLNSVDKIIYILPQDTILLK